MLPPDQADECTDVLAHGAMFRRVMPADLRELSRLHMTRKVFKRGDVIVAQGAPSTTLYAVAEGEVIRTRTEEGPGGRSHVMSEPMAPYNNAAGRILNSLRIVDGDPTPAAATCGDERCVAYALGKEQLMRYMAKKPRFAEHVVKSLCEEVRETSFRLVDDTPLLQQQHVGLNFGAFSVAAAIESFYRSALNAKINEALSGVRAPYFPRMHVQLPTRVVYINGFKGLRAFFDQHATPEAGARYGLTPDTVRLSAAIAPGIVMTPVASILEASNAGHLNKEPLLRRATRGVLPRGLREVIFGVGINQLSEFFEERAGRHTENSAAANAAGSLAAGTVAGYLSHVPHNLSTYKLLDPSKSYATLFAHFVDKSVSPAVTAAIDRNIPSRSVANAARCALALLFPRGLMVRTTQIVGSFMILNGIIRVVEDFQRPPEAVPAPAPAAPPAGAVEVAREGEGLAVVLQPQARGTLAASQR